MREEWHGWWKKDRAKKRLALLSNPYGFTKKIFGKKSSGFQLKFIFLKDANRWDLTETNSLIRQDDPTIGFNLKEPTWEEIKAVIKIKRSASDPGLNSVLYNVIYPFLNYSMMNSIPSISFSFRKCSYNPKLVYFVGDMVAF